MSADFHEVVFPSRLALGIEGGPELHVDTVRLASGHEQRNSRWSRPLWRYTLMVGRRPLNEIRELLAFYEARGGALHGFRFKDPILSSTAAHGDDISPEDVLVGVGDGIKTLFQLTLSSGRIITKPVLSTFAIALDGEPMAAGFSVNDAGVLTFEQPIANDVTISAGFEFHVPVRFENQQLIATKTAHDAGEVSDIILLEVRL